MDEKEKSDGSPGSHDVTSTAIDPTKVIRKPAREGEAEKPAGDKDK